MISYSARESIGNGLQLSITIANEPNAGNYHFSLQDSHQISLTRTRGYQQGEPSLQNNFSPPQPLNLGCLTCLHVSLLRKRLSDLSRLSVPSPRPRKRGSLLSSRTPSLTRAGCCSQWSIKSEIR